MIGRKGGFHFYFPDLSSFSSPAADFLVISVSSSSSSSSKFSFSPAMKFGCVAAVAKTAVSVLSLYFNILCCAFGPKLSRSLSPNFEVILRLSTASICRLAYEGACSVLVGCYSWVESRVSTAATATPCSFLSFSFLYFVKRCCSPFFPF